MLQVFTYYYVMLGVQAKILIVGIVLVYKTIYGECLVFTHCVGHSFHRRKMAGKRNL